VGPRTPEVDEWFDRYDNRMLGAVQRTREILLAADPRLDEAR
jgi:hypothetical protein